MEAFGTEHKNKIIKSLKKQDMILNEKFYICILNCLDEFHNMDINSALNIVQFVEIYEKIWYNKVSETNTF